MHNNFWTFIKKIMTFFQVLRSYGKNWTSSFENYVFFTAFLIQEDSWSFKIVSDPDPTDLSSCQVITDPDPTCKVISDSDPDR